MSNLEPLARWFSQIQHELSHRGETPKGEIYLRALGDISHGIAELRAERRQAKNLGHKEIVQNSDSDSENDMDIPCKSCGVVRKESKDKQLELSRHEEEITEVVLDERFEEMVAAFENETGKSRRGARGLVKGLLKHAFRSFVDGCKRYRRRKRSKHLEPMAGYYVVRYGRPKRRNVVTSTFKHLGFYGR